MTKTIRPDTPPDQFPSAPSKSADFSFEGHENRPPAPYLYLIATLGLLTVALYASRFAWMVRMWRTDDNYGHGFFIPLLAAYFIWDRWDEISKTPIRLPAWSSLLGAAMLALALFMHLAGVLGSERVLSDASLVVCLMGLALTFLGPRLFAKLIFPIFFLSLMIPPPENLYKSVTVPLQDVASYSSAVILNAINVPVDQVGNMLHFGLRSDGTPRSLEVAEACSGVRSLLGLLAMGFTLAYLMLKKWLPRIILILVTAPVAIFFNILRVTITGLLYDQVDEKFAEGFLHFFSGWLVFVFALGVLIMVVKVLHIIFEMEIEDDSRPGPSRPELDIQRSVSS